MKPHLCSLLVLLGAAFPARGQLLPLAEGGLAAFEPAARSSDPGVVVDHPPHPYGGPAADTEFIGPSGNPSWQLLADDFRLNAPATIRRIRWHGFYGATFGGYVQPPLTETFRLRVHDARPQDGLPGTIVYEETVLDPQREATGRYVYINTAHPEFIYEINLATPLALTAATTYWLSIVQLGDPNSHFRWEYSVAELNDHVFQSSSVPNWTVAGIDVDLAFQLSTIPEPSSVLLWAFATVSSMAQRRREV